MANIITVTSYAIYPKGESMFSEKSYTVSREDDGAGEFISITDGTGNVVRIDPDDVDDLFRAVKLLMMNSSNED